jgi:hypothetical protein
MSEVTKNIENESCCTVVCETPLNKDYWDAQYQSNTIGWDLGQVSPPLKNYIDSISDKSARILIPGAGNAYEADYLVSQGFQNITIIDIAPTVVESLQKTYSSTPQVTILLGDFFEHKGSYDVILEQTFFCALAPFLRQRYVWKMHQLLAPKGKIAGLLFNRTFEKSPPFGGSKEEYQLLFKDAFSFIKIEECTTSIGPRMGSELFIEFEKNESITVALYNFTGMHCSSCQKKITILFNELPKVLNASISSDYSQVLLVSNEPIELSLLEATIAYDEAYKIIPVM